MEGLTSAASAQQEAWEEAGVCGIAFPTPLGSYTYRKPELRDAEVEVVVYPLFVQHMRSDYPEKGLREFTWAPPDIAADLVAESGLRSILAGFVT